MRAEDALGRQLVVVRAARTDAHRRAADLRLDAGLQESERAATPGLGPRRWDRGGGDRGGGDRAARRLGGACRAQGCEAGQGAEEALVE
eukprot:4174342-Prymnesium_polylepis.1